MSKTLEKQETKASGEEEKNGQNTLGKYGNKNEKNSEKNLRKENRKTRRERAGKNE